MDQEMMESRRARQASPLAVAVSAGLIGALLLAMAIHLDQKEYSERQGFVTVQAEVVDTRSSSSGSKAVAYTYTFDDREYCSGEFFTRYEGDEAIRDCQGWVSVSPTTYRSISRIKPLPVHVDKEHPERSEPVPVPYSTWWMYLLGGALLLVAAQQGLAAARR